jgi:hypothetical protein
MLKKNTGVRKSSEGSDRTAEFVTECPSVRCGNSSAFQVLFTPIRL